MRADSIEGTGVRLRRYRAADAGAVRAACNDPLTQRFLPALPRPYTEADAQRWVTEGAAAAFPSGGNFAIADPGTDALIGSVGLLYVQENVGSIGYWIAPQARGRGVATAAARALTEYAFTAGYARIELRTELENAASQRVALGAGYTREGVGRAAGARPGGRDDLIVWARVAGDPPGPTPRHLPDLPGGELTDGVVRLTPMRAADAPAVQLLPCAPAAPEETVRYCAHADAAWLADQEIRLTIRDVATGAFAGRAGLTVRHPDPTQAEIDCRLIPARQGHGYATRAVKLLCGWALTGTALERLVAGVPTPDLAAQRVLERSGFVREGQERRTGGRTDLYRYALLRPGS
ncbi:GNAT family N-acetyltransferase [Couchioplanes caeruleus]|uniref:GNAT family N-acetyltransferase n=1 Tax=Couchioplanes caeruleus TaxID=56438 RepID=UPI003D320DA5